MTHVELRDAKQPMQVIFAWWASAPEERPNYSMLAVTLDCPWAFRVSSTIGNSEGLFGKELAAFVQSIDALAGDWQGARSMKSLDEDFVITCFECHRGQISVEVSLDSSWDDPEWTVQLRLTVDKEQWSQFAHQLEAFVSKATPSDA